MLFMKLFKSEKQNWNRQQRISQEVQRFISSLFMRQALPPTSLDENVVMADPMTTISRADVSPDMKSAKIYVRHIDESKLESALVYLNTVKSAVRKLMAKELNMRFTPALTFLADLKAQEEAHIENLFEKIKIDKKLNPDNSQDDR